MTRPADSSRPRAPSTGKVQGSLRTTRNTSAGVTAKDSGPRKSGSDDDISTEDTADLKETKRGVVRVEAPPDRARDDGGVTVSEVAEAAKDVATVSGATSARSDQGRDSDELKPVRWYAVLGALAALSLMALLAGGGQGGVFVAVASSSGVTFSSAVLVATVTPAGGPTASAPVATVTPMGDPPTPPVATVTPLGPPRSVVSTVTPGPGAEPGPSASPSPTHTAVDTPPPGSPTATEMATVSPSGSPTPITYVASVFLPIGWR